MMAGSANTQLELRHHVKFPGKYTHSFEPLCRAFLLDFTYTIPVRTFPYSTSHFGHKSVIPVCVYVIPDLIRNPVVHDWTPAFAGVTGVCRGEGYM